MQTKMNTEQKIYKAINETQHDNTQYTDDYDGFTHSTYSGLVEAVTEELENEGFDPENVSMAVVSDFVEQMIN